METQYSKNSWCDGDIVSAYCEAQKYIDEEIVRLVPRRRDPAGKVETVLRFNRDLGDPQRAFRSVQVAGTSGKGSTSFYLARLLSAHGLRAGLHVSPYLQVATEKTWVDGKYVPGGEFWQACQAIRPVVEAYRRDDQCPASVHGMASLGLTYEVFRARQVEWGVMETGLGGRYDLVQGLERRLSVITDIGYDHVETLGHTLEEIAWHKAGIMKGAPVCVAVYRPEVWPVYEKESKRYGCELVKMELADGSGESCRELGIDARGYSGRNMEVALQAYRLLASREGLKCSDESCRAALGLARFPGRMERLECDGVQVVLDAAHNEQKMRGLRGALGEELSREWVMVLGATGSRDVVEMLGHLGKVPAGAVVSRPHLYAKKTAEPAELVDVLKGEVPYIEASEDPTDAVERAMAMARRLGVGRVLVTGSLYLVGQVRNRFYPWRDVLLQQTSFPERVA